MQETNATIATELECTNAECIENRDTIEMR